MTDERFTDHAHVTPEEAGTVKDAKGKELKAGDEGFMEALAKDCLLYTSPSPRDRVLSRMPSSA